MALLSTAEIKTHIYGNQATAPTTHDVLFAQLVTQVESMIKQKTGVYAVDTAYEAIANEILDGSNDCFIEAKFKPVRAVTVLEVRGPGFTDWTEQTSEDYADMEFDGERIYTAYVHGGKGTRNLRLSYTVGYKTTETPEDLNLCAILMAVGLFNQRQAVGLKSQNILGMSFVLNPADTEYVTRILTQYSKADVI